MPVIITGIILAILIWAGLFRGLLRLISWLVALGVASFIAFFASALIFGRVDSAFAGGIGALDFIASAIVWLVTFFIMKSVLIVPSEKARGATQSDKDKR